MPSLIVTLALGVLTAFVGTASAITGEECDVCTCTSGDVVCLSVIQEVLEEQTVCNIACQGVGSTHGSRERVAAACSELPICGSVGAPAASGTWLAAGALGLLFFGMFGLRRLRSRATA